MVFNYKRKEVSVNCDCGCTQLNFNIDCLPISNDEDIDCSFNFSSNYLGKRNGRWRALWNVLCGKEVYYAEVCLSKKEARDFIKKVEELLDD